MNGGKVRCILNRPAKPNRRLSNEFPKCAAELRCAVKSARRCDRGNWKLRAGKHILSFFNSVAGDILIGRLPKGALERSSKMKPRNREILSDIDTFNVEGVEAYEIFFFSLICVYNVLCY